MSLLAPCRAVLGASLGLVVLATATLAGAPAQAQVDESTAAEQPTVDGEQVTGIVSEDPAVGIHPDVAALPTEGDELDEVAVDLRATLELRSSATARRDEAVARLAELEAERRDVAGRLASARLLHDRQEHRAEQARGSLREVALDAYVQAGGASSTSPLDPRTVDDDREREALASTVRQHHSEALLSATTALAVLDGHLVRLEARAEQLDEEVAATTGDRDAAEADLADVATRLPDEQAAVDDAWRTSFVRGTDLPLVAVDAYYRAALALVLEDPSCGLRWEALAGIGRVEGHHGSFGSSVLQPDGTSEPRIFGIPLDGTRNTRAIGDTDGGRLDGLADVDRAVGPMQFIPSTWVRWATDGDGDGEADPHSLHDAARTAGVYLCQAGPGLSTDEGLLRAFFSYNRSTAYGQRVLGLTHEYDAVGL